MTADQWADDLMKRKDSGNFLYKLVQSKYDAYVKTNKSASLTFALDGGWGTGKSFFVERWSKDIEIQQHAVIRFDAWKNDLSDDPLVGFMAELNSALKPLIREIPLLSTHARKKLTQQAKIVTQNAGKALVPALTQLGKSMAVRYLSKEGLEEIQGIFQEENPSDPKEEIDNSKITDKAIGAYFENILKGHSTQKAAITKLVTELERLAKYLEDTNKIRLPIYVFIDELDRCRPSYAIRLLEGIKHLFNAQGVCFVVSTNLTQLSHSIKAVYGVGFDGQNYLKRFFDFEYKLPAPNNIAHAHFLFSGSPISQRVKIESGLQILDANRQRQSAQPKDIFAYIATAFNLDIRSQKQVFAQAEGAIASIPDTETVHILYMFALAALAHTAPDQIDELIDRSRINFPVDKIATGSYTTVFHELNGAQKEKKYSLSDIITFYHGNSNKTLEVISKENQHKNDREFPYSLLPTMLKESSGNLKLHTAKYLKLIRLAGDITAASA